MFDQLLCVFWCWFFFHISLPLGISSSNPSGYQLVLKAAEVCMHWCVCVLCVCFPARVITPAQTTCYRLPVNRHFSAHHLFKMRIIFFISPQKATLTQGKKSLVLTEICYNCLFREVVCFSVNCVFTSVCLFFVILLHNSVLGTVCVQFCC